MNVTQHILQEVQDDLVACLKRHGYLTKKEILEHIPILNRQILKKGLFDLEKRGIVRREFSGMRTLYCLIHGNNLNKREDKQNGNIR